MHRPGLGREIGFPSNDLMSTLFDPAFEGRQMPFLECTAEEHLTQPIDFKKQKTGNIGFGRFPTSFHHAFDHSAIEPLILVEP